METKFSSEFFRNNRANLKTLFVGRAPIILTANGVLQSSADMTFPFRQDSNFWYLTGIDEPDAILVVDKNKEYIILSEDHEHRAKFDGALNAETISEISGVELVLDYKEGWAILKTRLKKVKHFASIAPSPAYVAYYGFYTNPARSRMIEKVKSINEKIELLDLKQHLSTMRMVKQPLEIEAIKQAIATTGKTLTAIAKKKWPQNTTEKEIENELSYQFRKNGADGLAFDSIVASGENAVIIHHKFGLDPIPKNGFLLIDLGAEINHYAADITRIFTVGKPTKRMLQVYDAALDALDVASGKLKPGVVLSQYEEEMMNYVGEKLRELGLIKTIDRDSVRKYFPTLASHHLGLDAHDMSDSEKPLAANMVLAVEPGIYIPEEGIGIRVEENVLITPGGAEILSSGLSRDLLSLTIKQD